MKIRKIIFTTAPSALVCFGLCQQVQSVTDTPDPGSLPTSNTADGQGALGSLTTGLYNSAFGFLSVLSLSDANFDTGVGAGALLVDNGGTNTAVGAGALFSNTTGSDNTAVGAFALFNSTTAGLNVAVGDSALVSFNGTTAFDGANTALGSIALSAETSGEENVAVGRRALESLTAGSNNTAVGWRSGDNVTTNDNHVFLGDRAGNGITTVNNNIVIGHLSGVHSVFGQVSDRCFIDNIFGAPVSSGTAAFVLVDSDGRLGTFTVAANGSDTGGFSPLPAPRQAVT